jgi:hypothetical protein
MKNTVFILPILMSVLIAGCSPGFTVFLKNTSDSTNEPVSQADGLPTTNSVAQDSLENGPQGGQPGSVTVAGSIVQMENGKPQLSTRIKILQTGGRNTLGQLAEIKTENKAQLHSQLKLTRLDRIEERTDYLEIGCNTMLPEIAGLIRGLRPLSINLEAKDSLDIKAKLVLLCGKIILPQAFVTIVTDHLVLMNTSYDLPSFNGVGFFSALTQKLTLNGSNQIIGKGLDSAGAIADGPSLLLATQKELLGQGTLDLKTIGGNRLESGKSK